MLWVGLVMLFGVVKVGRDLKGKYWLLTLFCEHDLKSLSGSNTRKSAFVNLSKATKSVICDYFNHFGQVAKWAFFLVVKKSSCFVLQNLFMVKWFATILIILDKLQNGLFSSSEEKLMFCIAKLFHGQVQCTLCNWLAVPPIWHGFINLLATQILW